MDQAEASGKTVDDAFKAALAILGANADEVEMTVLDEGRRGNLFGRGSKDATVRVERVSGDDSSEREQAPVPEARSPRAASSPRPARAPRAPRAASGPSRGLEAATPKLREEDFLGSGGGARAQAPAAPARGGRPPRPEGFAPRPPAPERSERPPRRRRELENVDPDINAEEVELAAQVLDDILRILRIDAGINIREPLSAGDGLGSVRAVIDIKGEDLGLLIGRRGDTLSSLQHILNTIISRRFEDSGGVSVDVEHYRHRREEQLSALAGRMAERVRRQGSPITLEPMTANDRRLIHLALSNDPEIETYSVGEGEARKVVISVRE